MTWALGDLRESRRQAARAGPHAGSPDAAIPDMATTSFHNYQDFELHDHAGARWLAPFLAVFVLVIGAMLAMLVYPHVTG